MKTIRLLQAIFICFLLHIFTVQPANSQSSKEIPVYLDYTKSDKIRAADLLQRLTLEEKLSQMITRIPADLKRFGIKGYQWGGEAGHCVIARAKDMNPNDASTIFPSPIGMAATWNRKLNQQVGNAMSDEARARFHAGLTKSTLTFWAPVVELARDPRWGRTEECYGEDPYLTSQLSLAFVKGLQGEHPKYLKAVAGPKHYALNNEEWCRHNGSSNTDEQLLHDYYLKPYKVLVQEGKAEQIMASYNRVNGVPSVSNKYLLTDVLRKQWGFDGTVVSDCNGIRDLYEGHKYVKTVQEAIAAALNAGMDLECGDCFKDFLYETVKKGLVSEATIDSAVFRILVSRFRLGLFDPPDMVPYSKIPMSVVDGPVNRELARQTARESIVLLKNTGNLLPLDKHKVKSVAVIGPGGKTIQMGGYIGAYSKAVSPYEGIVLKLDSSKVTYSKGTDVKITLPVIPSGLLLPGDKNEGIHGLKGEYFNNPDFSGQPVFVRIDSLIDFSFGKGTPDPRLPVDYYSIRWTGQFIAPLTGSYFIGGDFDDAIKLWFDGKKIIDRTLNRNRSSEAVKIEIEKGKKYDLKLEYTEQWYNAQVKLWGAASDPGKFNQAVEAAKNSEFAVVVLGTDESVEKEGVDRADMNLPGDQEELLKAVFAVNPSTIVVLQNGSSLSVNWISEHIPAVLETWYSAEEGGNAIADVIFGDYNPAGRLPLTFYGSTDDLPSISDYDIRKGRTYMYPDFVNDKGQKRKIKPLYPFGHGLSYTQFAYTGLEISENQIHKNGSVTLKVTVKNSGNYFGDEVVQVYGSPEKINPEYPVKQLTGFERVSLYPGETKTIEFKLKASEFGRWDKNKKEYVVAPGKYRLQVGGSSANIKLSCAVNIR